MALDLSTNAADEYFGPRNHVKHSIWAGFDDDQRAAALAQAARQVSGKIGGDVANDTDIPDSFYRPSYAVFEQALYLLQNSFSIPNAEMTAPHFSAIDGDGDGIGSRARDEDELSGAASRFLQRPQRAIYLVRG